MVLLAFLAAGGVFWWQSEHQPVEQPVAIVLTDIEAAVASGELLRHEHITQLSCRVLDEQTNALVEFTLSRPGAVAKPSGITVPNGDYLLHCTVRFKAAGARAVSRNYQKPLRLDGEKITVRL